MVPMRLANCLTLAQMVSAYFPSDAANIKQAETADGNLTLGVTQQPPHGYETSQ